MELNTHGPAGLPAFMIAHTQLKSLSIIATVPLMFKKMTDLRKALSAFHYFKDNKFNGNMCQSIELALCDYSACSRQHSLTLKRKENVLSILL